MRRSAADNWRIVCLASAGLFVILGLAAFATGTLPGDVLTRRGLLDHTSEDVLAFARWANYGGRPQVLAPGTILLLWLSAHARQRWWLWCFVQPAAAILEHAFKFLVGRPRPSGSSLGYPSGHTTAATTFAVIVIYFSLRERLTPLERRIIQVLAVLLMLGVAWARIVVRAHWPSDVIGGLLLGICCAAAAAWWNETHPLAARAASRTRKVTVRSFWLALAGALALTGLGPAQASADALLAEYSIRASARSTVHFVHARVGDRPPGRQHCDRADRKTRTSQ